MKWKKSFDGSFYQPYAEWITIQFVFTCLDGCNYYQNSIDDSKNPEQQNAYDTYKKNNRQDEHGYLEIQGFLCLCRNITGFVFLYQVDDQGRYEPYSRYKTQYMTKYGGGFLV